MVTKSRAAETLEHAYRQCVLFAKSHYENFPVASLFLPKAVRRPIAVIYTFARLADDIADEGDLSQEQRLIQLQVFKEKLNFIDNIDPVFIALNDVINKHSLSMNLFFDLLQAFEQDIIKKDYANFEEILEYCRYSANPVGRLLLHLTHNATSQNLEDSDALCTALQLINFLQDIHSDLSFRQRCYLPKDEMDRRNITKEELLAKKETSEIQDLINHQIQRAERLLQQGSALGYRLKGLFGLEIRLIIAGGNQILQCLKNRTDLYYKPKLRFYHWPKLWVFALFKTKPC